jgi:hypothetical protein
MGLGVKNTINSITMHVTNGSFKNLSVRDTGFYKQEVQ